MINYLFTVILLKTVIIIEPSKLHTTTFPSKIINSSIENANKNKYVTTISPSKKLTTIFSTNKILEKDKFGITKCQFNGTLRKSDLNFLEAVAKGKYSKQHKQFEKTLANIWDNSVDAFVDPFLIAKDLTKNLTKTVKNLPLTLKQAIFGIVDQSINLFGQYGHLPTVNLHFNDIWRRIKYIDKKIKNKEKVTFKDFLNSIDEPEKGDHLNDIDVDFNLQLDEASVPREIKFFA